MSPRQRLVLGSTVAIALAMSACSGSDDAADTTASSPTAQPSETTVADSAPTSDPTTSAAPSTVAATEPTTSEVAPATNESATTAETTTAPPPSDAPSTPDEEVATAIEFFEQQWKECLRTLPDCDEVVVADRRLGDVNVETAITASLFNDSDYRAVRIEELDYRVDEVTVADDGATAQAVVCVTDPVEITQADGTPVDGMYLTSVQEFGLELQNDEWAWSTRTIGDTFEGEENSVCV